MARRIRDDFSQPSMYPLQPNPRLANSDDVWEACADFTGYLFCAKSGLSLWIQIRFGTSNTSLGRRDLRLWVPQTFLRSLGLRPSWSGAVESSSNGSRKNELWPGCLWSGQYSGFNIQHPIVSYRERCYFLCILTPRVPGGSGRGCVEVFNSSSCKSPTPRSFAPLPLRSFLPFTR